MRTHNLFESPGLYRIRVRGHIDEGRSDYLGGMIIIIELKSAMKPFKPDLEN